MEEPLHMPQEPVQKQANEFHERFFNATISSLLTAHVY